MSLVNSGNDSCDGNTDINLDHLVCKVDDSANDITSEKPAESAQVELSMQTIIYSTEHCSPLSSRPPRKRMGFPNICVL